MTFHKNFGLNMLYEFNPNSNFTRVFGGLIVMNPPQVEKDREYMFLKLKGSMYHVNMRALISDKATLEFLKKLSKKSKLYYYDNVGNQVSFLIYKKLLGNVEPIDEGLKREISKNVLRFYRMFVEGNELNVLNTFMNASQTLGASGNASVFICPDYGLITVFRKIGLHVKRGVHVLSIGECIKHFVNSVKSGSNVTVDDSNYPSFPNILSINKFSNDLALVTIANRTSHKYKFDRVIGDLFLYKKRKVERVDLIKPDFIAPDFKSLLILKEMLSKGDLIPVSILGGVFVLVSRDYSRVFIVKLPPRCEILVRKYGKGVNIGFKVGRHDTVVSFDKVFDDNFMLL